MKYIYLLLLLVLSSSILLSQQPSIQNVNLQYTSFKASGSPFGSVLISTGDPHAECFINVHGIVTTNSNYWFYGQTLAVPENEVNKTVNVYPNPTTDNIFIASGFDNTNDIVVELFTTTGAVVYQGILAENNGAIGVGNLPAGLYIGIIKRNNSTLKTFKITKL